MMLKLLIAAFFACLALAETPGYTWKHCERPDDKNVTVPFSADGIFRPDCAPDVLYSWRGEEVFEIHKKNWQEKKIIFSDYSSLFTSRTPLASHGYGTRSIRIKLRDDVVFASANAESGGLNRNCDYYKAKYPSDYKKMVIVASLKNFYDGFSEYILCTEGPIASWSYGTPEHLQEMERERQFIEGKTPDEMDAVYKPIGVTNSAPCPDGKSCSVASLIQRLERMMEAVAKGDGDVFYMPGTPQDRGKHFSVKRPGYFQYAEDPVKFSMENTLPASRPAKAKVAPEIMK